MPSNPFHKSTSAARSGADTVPVPLTMTVQVPARTTRSAIAKLSDHRDTVRRTTFPIVALPARSASMLAMNGSAWGVDSVSHVNGTVDGTGDLQSVGVFKPPRRGFKLPQFTAAA